MGRPFPRVDWRRALDEEIWELRGRLVEIRRDIHRHPELAFEETRTAGLIADHLGDLDIEPVEGIAGTGVVGVLEGERQGPTVMWRADMDALPIQEKPKGDYTSRKDGVMHACGHDGHVAIALGLATVLAERREDLRGTVKFVFQPGEEGGEGARRMVKEGVLRDPEVEAVFGLHLDNEMPTGCIGLSEGTALAAASDFRVRLLGQGGHAATPHLTADPIVASSYLVTALQALVSRQVDPMAGIVVSIGSIHGGTAENIIPKEVVLEGTVRCFEDAIQKDVLGRIERMAKGIADGFGLQCRVERQKGTPATRNDPKVAARVREVLAGKLGRDAVQPLRILGSEDMSFFLEKVPGCYFMLGSRNDAKGCNASHHSPEFDFDEDVLPLGVQLAASVVEAFLEEERPARGREGRRRRRRQPEAETPAMEEVEPEEIETEEEVYASRRREEDVVEEEEEEEGEDLEFSPETGEEQGEIEFSRTRKRRRRRGASRERREALLPEHLGPRARDAEAAAIAAERQGGRRPETDRRETRAEEEEEEAPREGRHGSRAREEDREEEEKPYMEEAVGASSSAQEEEIRHAAPRRRKLSSPGSGYLHEGDLVPAHRKASEKGEEEEGDAKPERPKSFGAAPWLWKGRKTRR